MGLLSCSQVGEDHPSDALRPNVVPITVDTHPSELVNLAEAADPRLVELRQRADDWLAGDGVE